MNYLRYGLEKKNLKRLGKFLAAFFAVLGIGASFGGGNMLQSNQAFKIVSEQIPALQGHGFMFGVLFALLVGADRKSTRLNFSHVRISYAVFCLKKKNKTSINNHIIY